MILRLGIIGMSEGNGHPYSWAAIFNGYDPVAMNGCGFPVIPKYLSEQEWPNCRLGGAVVTHVWTQDENLSRHIARAALIENVVLSLDQMLGQVDAVLLARDDAENHLRFAEPFLAAGLPIYVDKPIAVDRFGLENLLKKQTYDGQIFSCSALRYAAELRLLPKERIELGDLRRIVACTPKKWDTYAVHLIEPMLQFLPSGTWPVEAMASGAGDLRRLMVEFNDGLTLEFESRGERQEPLNYTIFGANDTKKLEFKDSFSAFRMALKEFVEGVLEGRSRLTNMDYRRVVSLIEAGRRDGRHSFADGWNRQAWRTDGPGTA